VLPPGHRALLALFHTFVAIFSQNLSLLLGVELNVRFPKGFGESPVISLHGRHEKRQVSSKNANWRVKYVKTKAKKTRKQLVAGVICVIILLAVAFGFFFKQAEGKNKLTGDLYVYNWADYFGETTIQDFEREFGVKVHLDTFDDEYRLLETNLSKYDLIVASDTLIRKLISSNSLEPLRMGNIPNLEFIDEKCIEKNSEKYAAPYFFGTTGLAFNTKYLPVNTSGWDVLWNVEYSGKVGVLNNPDEALGMAAKYVGLPLVPQTSFQLDRVKQFLLLQKPIVGEYKTDIKVLNGLVSGDLWASQSYDSTAREAMEENSDIKYVFPREGGSKWIDNFAIIKGSRNRYAAEVFINYVLRPEVSKEITEYQLAYSCNRKVVEELNSTLFGNIPKSAWKFAEFFSSYNDTPEMRDLKMNVWKELTDK
jgi:spermidine/putrescine transport system substrate-binding protein